jgi:hypothetical protein
VGFSLEVWVIIVLALAFDFINGFHDAANSIATVVSTRVLSPQKAVVWAAFFNFVAAFVLGTHVAKTLGQGMIDLSVVSREVVLAGLIGAILWNLITWYYGIPVSSSHAPIGGYAGAAVAKAGRGSIIVSGWTLARARATDRPARVAARHAGRAAPRARRRLRRAQRFGERPPAGGRLDLADHECPLVLPARDGSRGLEVGVSSADRAHRRCLWDPQLYSGVVHSSHVVM